MQEQFTLPQEEWRPVVGYEGWYEVSNLGRVRRIAPNRYGKRPGILRLDTYGPYVIVGLTRNSITKAFKVHRLVATAFIRPSAPGEQTNHKDADKHNNQASNLEWVTAKQNQRHAVQMGLRDHISPPHFKGERNGRAKLTASQVHEIRALRGRLTQQRIADRFGISQTQVVAIQLRQQWCHI